MNFYHLIFLAFLHVAFSSSPKLVIELFRHGARGPLYHQNDNYWKGKEGQLTHIGRAQHLVLGASMIQQYPHLKEALKDPNRLYLQSTQFDRTIESLKHHLWGLYHGENLNLDQLDIYEHDFYKKYQNHEAAKYFSSWNHSEIMGFTPSEIHINPLAQDYELLTLEPFFCPNTDELLEVEHREEFDFIMNMVGYHIAYHTNTSFNAQQIYDLYDLIYANLFEGKDLIHNITTDSQVWNHIKHGAEYYVTYTRYGSELKRRLYGMPLLQKIMKFLEESQEGTLPYDLVLLSAHDITVFNLITALGIVHPKCFIDKMHGDEHNSHCRYPNYASQFLVELWDRNGEAKIRLLYEKELVNLCGTKDGECTLEQFKDIFVKNYAGLNIEDIFKHCGKDKCNKLKAEIEEGNESGEKEYSPCEFNQEDW